jgi:hypothetical protein
MKKRKDRVVKLEDIMDDIYATKFGKNDKKRTHFELTEDNDIKTKSSKR